VRALSLSLSAENRTKEDAEQKEATGGVPPTSQLFLKASGGKDAAVYSSA
jgi:hypothetical protein